METFLLRFNKLGGDSCHYRPRRYPQQPKRGLPVISRRLTAVMNGVPLLLPYPTLPSNITIPF